MTVKLITRLVLIIALLLFITGCQLSSETTGITSPTSPVEDIEADNLAPDFMLTDLEGKTVTLSALRGSPVILNFWATWCRPCRNEMPFIQEIYEKWQDKGLVILAINIEETSSEVQLFMQNNNFSFPVLLDTSGDVSAIFQIHGIPTTFFIDKDDIIKDKRIGSFNNAAEIEDYLNLIMP
jgi:thiol-disulfide isomerase/thioredoxin